MEKNALVVLIVSLTVSVVSVWLFVDFIAYRKRKREAREKNVQMFYHAKANGRLFVPHSSKAKK